MQTLSKDKLIISNSSFSGFSNTLLSILLTKSIINLKNCGKIVFVKCIFNFSLDFFKSNGVSTSVDDADADSDSSGGDDSSGVDDPARTSSSL